MESDSVDAILLSRCSMRQDGCCAKATWTMDLLSRGSVWLQDVWRTNRTRLDVADATGTRVSKMARQQSMMCLRNMHVNHLP